MGRMLETLKQSEAHRSSLATKTTAAPTILTPTECVVDWSLADEEAPFIEVGGPGKKVVVSPGLRKHPAVQPPHAPLEKPKSPAVDLAEAKPMAVAFEAWPIAVAGSPPIAPEVVAYHHPEHPVSKEYAALLEKLLAGMHTRGAPVVLPAGVRPGLGATTVLLNLAVVAAQAKKRVVIVDANFARPALAQRLGLSASVGVREVAAGTLAVEQGVVKSAIAGLHLLPAGSSASKAVPLSADATAWLLAWLRERFDLILIDVPALNETEEIAPIVTHSDGVFLVLPHSESPAVDKGIAHSIAQMGGRLRGLIHTRFEQ